MTHGDFDLEVALYDIRVAIFGTPSRAIRERAEAHVAALVNQLEMVNDDLSGSLAREAAHRARMCALPEMIAAELERVRDSGEHFDACSLTQAADIVRGFDLAASPITEGNPK